MYTQYVDPKIFISKPDWVIGLLWSFVGGYLAYKAFSFSITNPGEVWVYTVVISVVSPRAFRFLVNHNNQDRLINSIFNRFARGQNNKEDDNNRNI